MLRDLSKKTDISTVRWARREIDKFLDSFLSVFWYNGYSGCLEKLKDYIEENKKSKHVDYPDHILKYDVNSIDGILWSTLVVMFGEYGTSPRFGWIDEVGECLYFLDWFIKLFEDKEGD